MSRSPDLPHGPAAACATPAASAPRQTPFLNSPSLVFVFYFVWIGPVLLVVVFISGFGVRFRRVTRRDLGPASSDALKVLSVLIPIGLPTARMPACLAR